MKRLIKGIFYTWILMALSVSTFLFITYLNNKLDKLDEALVDVSSAITLTSNQAKDAKNNALSAQVTADDAKAKPTLDNKVSRVLSKAKPSVVYIVTSIRPQYKAMAEANGVTGESIGSGWFVKVTDTHAYVVTNHHVIEDSLKYPSVLSLAINDLETPWDYPAKVIGYDIISDLAVLEVERKPYNDWTPLVWADHNTTREGDPVVIIGHGLSLPWSMSTGIITALDRWQIRRYQFMMQSDAVVNKGNSGGPMLNLDGEVIGVVDAILDPAKESAAYAGVSLMIAGWQAEKVINDILEENKTKYAAFDFLLENPERHEWEELFSQGYDFFVRVGGAAEDSIAYKAGLRVGDYIDTIDGELLTGVFSLIKHVLAKSPSDVVKLGVYRKNEEGKLQRMHVYLPLMDLEKYIAENSAGK